MYTPLLPPRGDTAKNQAHTGANGSITVDTQAKTIRVHDGVTAGGTPLSKVGHQHAQNEIIAALGFTPVDPESAEIKQISYDSSAVPASEIDCSLGNFFKKTVSGNLNWTAVNVPTGRFYSFILQLANGGAGAMTWFAGTKWAGGVAPTLTPSGVDILGFYTEDGGTNWRGVVLALDSK